MWITLFLFACKGVEAAPEDLDGLTAWLWRGYEDASNKQIADAVRNLDEAVGAELFAEGQDGRLTALTPEDAALVGLSADPADAVGLYLVRDFGCTLPELEGILAALDQGAQYPDVYNAYDRAYTSDFEAWEGTESATLAWEVDYTATLLGDTYSAHIIGGLRRIPDISAEETPFGPALLSRVYLPEAAIFEEETEKSLSQDYQIELFYEREPGRIAHAYGMWRASEYGSGLNLEDDAVARILLNNLSDWDDQTAALCEAMR